MHQFSSLIFVTQIQLRVAFELRADDLYFPQLRLEPQLLQEILCDYRELDFVIHDFFVVKLSHRLLFAAAMLELSLTFLFGFHSSRVRNEHARQ